MLKGIKNVLGDLNGTTRADGGTLVAESDEGDSPDAQYRLGAGEQEDVGGKSDEPHLDINQVFEILKNQRRRYVLEYLRTETEQVRLGELAEQIAAWECEKEKRAITSQERKRVYVGLYQCHLPKMDDVGAISYNKPRGKVEPGDNIEFFHRYLPTERRDTERSPTVRSAAKKILSLYQRK